MDIFSSMKFKFIKIFLLLIIGFQSPVLYSATVANDGGITLWVSYDNLDSSGAQLSDTITEANSMVGGFSCGTTNTGRSDVGEPDSPPSCPGGTGSCTGEEKVSGDIEKLADYIFQSSEGAHYLRRVYISDQGRAWNSADVKWNIGLGGSSAPVGGWSNPDRQMSMNSGYRTCFHDVLHHELGHYYYSLPDRYARVADGYYTGTISGGTEFDVAVTGRDINTVMSNNFPHLFVDTTNARIVVDYNQPGPGTTTGEVLTPDLLSDADANNDGPDRAHHGFTMPFVQDEWSLLPRLHVDLGGVHSEGSFPDAGTRPDVDIVIIGSDLPHPGIALVLDRSGSMGVTTNGITAAQFVQEAGMYLYHSSEPGDLVGTYLYNASVEELFPYAEYDETNDLPFASFRNASGATDIAEALETSIDDLIAEHGEGGVSGAEIYLMSDGRQTTGNNLWDQVTRANDLGIKINTFAFGNADTTTMDSIANDTSGSVTPMSERDDAAELKMIMGRKMSTGRGLTPIFSFKGKMKNKINLGSTQIHVGQFNVPPKSRNLQFYTFLHQGDASSTMRISLKAPDGTDFNSPSPDNTAQKGRFNGVKLKQPLAGTWRYTILGMPGKSLPSEDVEFVAYADNRELKSQVWFGEANSKNQIPIYAQLDFRYPITQQKVVAHLYARGKLITSLPMFDDGKTADDKTGRDGEYTALLDISSKEWYKLAQRFEGELDKLRVEVEFSINKESRPAANAHYETGFTPELQLKDFSRGNKGDFKAWATGVLNLDEYRPRVPNKPRIICAESDHTTVSVGKVGHFTFTVENAKPVVTQLRVSLGQGIKLSVKATEDDKDHDKKSSNNSVYLSQTYHVEYEVSEKAKAGHRDLNIQFGAVRLTKEHIINITDS